MYLRCGGLFTRFTLFYSCSVVLLLHCQGWIAHQRKAKKTVSFLKKSVTLLSADVIANVSYLNSRNCLVLFGFLSRKLGH